MLTSVRSIKPQKSNVCFPSVLGGPMSGSVMRRGWYLPTLKAMSSASFLDGLGPIPRSRRHRTTLRSACGARRRVRLRDRPGRVRDVDLNWEQVVVDAHDPVALGRWWAEPWAWGVVGDAADEFEIRPTPDRVPGLLSCRFRRRRQARTDSILTSVRSIKPQKSNVSFPRCSARRRRVGQPSSIRNAEAWSYETVGAPAASPTLRARLPLIGSA